MYNIQYTYLSDDDLVDRREEWGGPLDGDGYNGVDTAGDRCVEKRDQNRKTPQNIRILKHYKRGVKLFIHYIEGVLYIFSENSGLNDTSVLFCNSVCSS